jgi:hypothetical protein
MRSFFAALTKILPALSGGDKSGQPRFARAAQLDGLSRSELPWSDTLRAHLADDIARTSCHLIDAGRLGE